MEEPAEALEPVSSEANAAEEPVTLAELERRHIIHTLMQTNGNRTDAAEILQVSTRTLRNKLAQYREEGISLPFA